MALDTIQKICEDNAVDLTEATLEDNCTPILDFIIPRLIPFIRHPTTRLRVLAISATNHFVQLKSPSLLLNMNNYLHSLFSIAVDEDFEVRQEVCRSFVMLLDNFTQSLLPYLDQLIQYMVFCNGSENTKVALEACDFWNQFATLDPSYRHLLVPYLPKVLPVILSCLIYTEEDLLMFGRGDEEENALKPRFTSRLKNYRKRYNESEDEEEEDEDEFFSEWTLRKFSATSLDALTSSFKSQVTHILLPLLNNTLFSDDWKIVESGILALGAAAEGKVNLFNKKVCMYSLV